MKDGASGALASGQPFQTVSGRHGRVGALLGAGGQGEVYDVSLDGLTFALKWYHRHYVEIDTTLRTRLDRAVRRGAPTEDFLWPLDLVDVRSSGSFGYVMPLRSGNYVSIRDLIAPPPRRLELSLPKRATICLHLANSFLELHASGFCYQDVNFGGFFLDPKDGRVLICDNDNVNVDGADASIYGTRKFMAPEVVRRECLPNSRTDLFSMSVLFFYTLFGWHPLDGRREAEIRVLDAAAELKLYGTEPRFLFDPNDTSNGPVEGFHDAIVARWRSLPEAVRSLFVRAFTDGLHDPMARVLETEWRTALRAVVDATLACGRCGFEHVADYRRSGLACPPACLACGEALRFPPMLLVNSRAILLEQGREIEQAALDRGSSRTSGACVEAHPSRPGLIGLRNRTAGAWQVTLPDGASHQVPAGQAVRLVPGSSLRFGRSTGRVVDPCDPEGRA
jgi:DNA-binding helix-hairpin-helix protein with protein kinase domain